MFKLPCDECKGQCCTFPVFTEQEFQVLRIVKGAPPPHMVMPMRNEEMYDKKAYPTNSIGYVVAKPDGVCPYLQDGKCGIYAIRPKVCRDYGVVPELPCQYLYPKLAEQKQNERIVKSRR
jgi:Fe-S-cluster containining protein